MKNSLTETTLSNGLKVFLKEIHTAPIISSWLWYRVGSRDEVQGKTGISHWVEHMQFKGTPQFPANMLDKAISREGGAWNAMTYLDWTAYFETMPADKIDLGLRLEADRMTNSQFDPNEVASERTVIISEREGGENEPLFMLGEAVQQTAFRVHPYHHEVIGDMADLRAMTRDDLYNHYREFYVPNNAVMAIAGDFETDKMLERIRELYEPIPTGKEPARVARPELPQNGEVRLSVEGPGSTSYVQACYRFPAASHPDFFPLSVLDSLLAGPSNLNMFSGSISNKTSRLYRALVDKEFAVSVHGGAQATIDPFLYGITVTIHPERKPEEALAALDKEIKRVQDEKVSKEEIVRAIKQARALFAYGSENITNQAFWMGYAEMFASYDWFQSYLEKLAKVTAKDIQRVANEYFKPQSRVVGTYVPMGGRTK
ncbi:MAG TPA: pitrilysin family protein [Anaerolineales bacterium]|nr:insulinase family protein [Anaerolineales bacterium]HMS01299.1 pitrilysin family protein [Anaerolineales bacterium]HNQ95863.1 pitrilysin family protein [Anaerolineales bacterium]HNS61980.1 pitrilysin family protein [Anaerolineales bacterium]